jgi:hypothetical protein
MTVGTVGAMASRPVAAGFDVIDTLMPLEPLPVRFTRRGLPPHLLELWFTGTLPGRDRARHHRGLRAGR